MLEPSILIRKAAEQDFGRTYEIFPRAITARWFQATGHERYHCFPRFEVVKRESPKRFMHFFTVSDVERLLQQWQGDCPRILSATDLSNWSMTRREERQQVVDLINFYGARRLKVYLRKWDQLPMPELGRVLSLTEALDFLLHQIHPETALELLESLPLLSPSSRGGERNVDE